MANDQQRELEERLTEALHAGLITRRQFLQTLMTAGLGLGGISVLGACATPAAPPPAAPTAMPAAPTAAPAGPTSPPSASARPLTPTF
jgi:hypothetical protein